MALVEQGERSIRGYYPASPTELRGSKLGPDSFEALIRLRSDCCAVRLRFTHQP
jgi:hypothetical protein